MTLRLVGPPKPQRDEDGPARLPLDIADIWRIARAGAFSDKATVREAARRVADTLSKLEASR